MRQAGFVGGAVAALVVGVLAIGAPPAGAVSFQHPPARAVSAQEAPPAVNLHEVHTRATTPSWIPGTAAEPGMSVLPLVAPLGPAGSAAPTGTAPRTDVDRDSAVPPQGDATAFGCPAALAYLEAYGAPDFIIQCPGNAQGHAATTMCINGVARCDLGRFIVIALPCPAAYMNEASNSWVLMGLSDARIDPYGSCR